MKSLASIKSHPLHPILVAFPIAFFTGTFGFHVAGWLLERPSLYETAYYLNVAGIIAGIAAAIPGILDFVYTVPPKSSGKKRATRHGITNSVMLLVFSGACFYRQEPGVDQWIILIMEMFGLALMSVAGWLGGTLVYRNQIGVDHRYANAGKWNEASLEQSSGKIKVATTGELNVNAMKLLRIGDNRLVLARTEDRYVVFDDRCPHRGGPLSDGAIMCGTVQCPWHGSQFDVHSGAVKAGPSREGIRCYEVVEEGSGIFLML